MTNKMFVCVFGFCFHLKHSVLCCMDALFICCVHVFYGVAMLIEGVVLGGWCVLRSCCLLCRFYGVEGLGCNGWMSSGVAGDDWISVRTDVCSLV